MPGQLDGNERVNIVGYGWGNKHGEKQYTMSKCFNTSNENRKSLYVYKYKYLRFSFDSPSYFSTV